jgi:hypothetical protein
MANKRRNCYTPAVDEGRKRVLGIITAILVAPKLKDYMWDGGSSAPSCESMLMSCVALAERIMRLIDQRFSSRA